MFETLTLQHALDWLVTLDLGSGLLMVGTGIALLVLGWRLLPAIISISLAGVGALAALNFASDGTSAVLLMLAAALLALAVALKMPRVSLAVLAGGWAALLAVGSVLWMGFGDGVCLVVGIIAFAVVVSVSFPAFRQTVAFVTSLQGTILFLGGLMVLLATQTTWWSFVRDVVVNNPIFFPFCLVAGTVTGYHFQLADITERDTGVSST